MVSVPSFFRSSILSVDVLAITRRYLQLIFINLSVSLFTNYCRCSNKHVVFIGPPRKPLYIRGPSSFYLNQNDGNKEELGKEKWRLVTKT
jgi:hypothetical protein